MRSFFPPARAAPGADVEGRGGFGDSLELVNIERRNWARDSA